MNQFPALIKACRPRQWLKNLLLAVPMLVGQQWNDGSNWVAFGWAFLCFGLMASSVYLLNDLRDIEADRLHPKKRKRPLASGALSPPIAWTVSPLLTTASLVLSVFVLPPLFVQALMVYLVATLVYTAFLKRKAMLDVVWLACLYTLRIIAGGAAMEILPSAWLLAFSIFIFMSIALAKRYSELLTLSESGKVVAAGRAYVLEDLSLLATMGVASGYLSVLVLALYIQSDAVKLLYHHPQVLWLVCPALLYWVSRFWHRVSRRKVEEDPMLHILFDPMSYAIGAVVVLVALMANVQWINLATG